MRPTPSGRQPHSRAVVGASIPVRDNGYASAGAPKGFSLASLETFGHRSWRETHDGKTQSVPSRRVRPSVSAARTAARSACCLPERLRFAL